MSSISNTSTNYSRISGMVSGLDTEGIVKSLITPEKNKINLLKADEQIYKWQQEAYQEIYENLNEFDEEFFDWMNVESNILSSSGIKTAQLFNANNDTERYVDIIVNSDAVNGTYKLNAITQLAEVASVQSSQACSGSIDGNIDLTTIPLDFTNETFSISLDGVIREISVDTTYENTTDMINDLNTKFNEQFGNGRVIASLSEDNSIKLSAPNSVIQVISGTEGSDFLESVGIEDSSRNLINLNRSAEEMFGESEDISFKINDVSFSFEKTTSLRDIINEINTSDANVIIEYSTLTDLFTLKSKETGESSRIEIENISGNFFGENSYINISETLVQNGKDAIFYLNDDGLTNPIKRSKNVFTIDGVTYSLKEETAETIEYVIKNNTDGLYDKITNFVTKFNELYDTIESKISEEKYIDFKPLSEEQREDMSDKEIELWEGKAKSGLLRKDSILTNIKNNLRQAFWDVIDGVNLSFENIGITISNDYKKFELEINESKLKEAISKDATSVISLFSKEEDINYSALLTSEEKIQRYEEVGFAQRVSDIINDNIRTSKDNYGTRGLLVEKAGIKGNYTQYESILYEQINDTQKRIDEAIEKMNNKEDYYWNRFAHMESFIQQLNSQGEQLYSMLSQ